MTNKFAYVNNLWGCHVKILDKINSKFNGKLDKINSKFIGKLDKINSKFNKKNKLILISVTYVKNQFETC
jgi:hypothetical protein